MMKVKHMWDGDEVTIVAGDGDYSWVKLTERPDRPGFLVSTASITTSVIEVEPMPVRPDYPYIQLIFSDSMCRVSPKLYADWRGQWRGQTHADWYEEYSEGEPLGNDVIGVIHVIGPDHDQNEVYRW